MKNWYRSTITGKVIPEFVCESLRRVYGPDAVNDLLSYLILERIESPSVISLLRGGELKSLAAFRYMETHDCDLRRAVHMVNLIEEDIRRCSIGKKS